MLCFLNVVLKTYVSGKLLENLFGLMFIKIRPYLNSNNQFYKIRNIEDEGKGKKVIKPTSCSSKEIILSFLLCLWS